MEIPLETINSDIALEICANECGAKCCDFYLNDFYARVNIEDYKKLKNADLDKFIVWDHGPPQLAKQPGGKCIFLNPDNNQCSIYPIRPLDCRNFPFAMKEKDVPNHCLLYHRSSTKLIEHEKSHTKLNKMDTPNDNLKKIEKEYITKSEGKLSLSNILEKFKKEIIIETSNGYYSIIYNKDNQIDQAERFIQNYEEQAEVDNYQILSLLGLNSKFDYTFHLNGIYRADKKVKIPIISEFPPQNEELDSLVQWSNTQSYQHLLSGFVMSQEVYKIINDKVQNTLI